MTDSAPPLRKARKQARTKARKLLDKLGVKKVIVVDDQAAPDGALAVAVLADQVSEKRLTIGTLAGASDEWTASAALDVFEALPIAERREIYGGLPKNEVAAKIETATDPLTVVRFLLEAEILLPAEWDARVASLANDHSTMVLFDMNMGPGLEREGLELLGKLHASHPHVRTAVLTNDISAENTLAEVEEMADEAGVAASTLLVTSKKELTSDDGGLGFLRLLTASLNAAKVVGLQTIVAEALIVAASAAANDFAKWQARELEDIAFGSSAIEGAWEIDTLLRILMTLQLSSARSELLTDEIQREVNEIREVSTLVTAQWRESTQRAKSVQSMERWVAGELVNRAGLPLANGDIFDIGGVEFILLAQPCDIAIRSKGQRGGDPETGTLVRIVPEVDLDKGTARVALPDGPSMEGMAFRIRPAFHAALCVLDLSWTNPQGACRFSAGQDFELRGPTPGTGHRAQKLSTWGSDLAAILETLPPESAAVTGFLAGSIGRVEGANFSPTWDPATRSVDFGCRRVRRLNERFAEAALADYCAALSRRAFEHPLERFVS